MKSLALVVHTVGYGLNRVKDSVRQGGPTARS